MGIWMEMEGAGLIKEIYTGIIPTTNGSWVRIRP